jgi:transposase
MRFVPIKTDDQLDLQALHRLRDRLISRRTSVINQLRAFLLERGITFRQGRAYLKRQMPSILEDAEVSFTPRMRYLLQHLWREWKTVEEQIDELRQQTRRLLTTMRHARDCGASLASDHLWPRQ